MMAPDVVGAAAKSLFLSAERGICDYMCSLFTSVEDSEVCGEQICVEMTLQKTDPGRRDST